jgi:ATP-dependent exoDNAse (exonuclease V) beta subunit
VSRLAAAHGRILGADATEIAAAEDAVRRVLDHPVMQAASVAAQNGHCHRETPMTLRLESGAIVEGVVDLVYEDHDGSVIVDFKTHRELEGDIERHRRQVQLYAAAIAAASGRPARGILLRV